MYMEIIVEVCTFLFYWKKNPLKLQQNSMFYGNEIKTRK
jgi:hypothetical protein